MILRREITASCRRFGGASVLQQHAVDPVTHAETPLQRLQVDVRRPAPDGFGDERLHELDDGRVAVARLPLFVAGRPKDTGRGRWIVNQSARNIRLCPMAAADGRVKIRCVGEHGLHRLSGHMGQAGR